jgi:hypothetical protein
MPGRLFHTRHAVRMARIGAGWNVAGMFGTDGVPVVRNMHHHAVQAGERREGKGQPA